MDPENRIVDLNPGALRLMRQQDKNLIGRSALEVFSDSPDLIRRLENVEETHEEITIERDEISYVYELRITSLYDRRQQLRCRVLLIHNITWLKEVERDLLEAKEEAEAASLAKSEFLANMSHEVANSSQIASMMGGRIEVESEEGKGRRCFLRLYLSWRIDAQAKPTMSGANNSASNRRIDEHRPATQNLLRASIRRLLRCRLRLWVDLFKGEHYAKYSRFVE